MAIVRNSDSQVYSILYLMTACIAVVSNEMRGLVRSGRGSFQGTASQVAGKGPKKTALGDATKIRTGCLSNTLQDW
jgi:hypothetical protein